MALQPTPLLRLTGHVLSARETEVPERTDNEGRTYEAFKFVEVAVLCAATFDGEVGPEVTAVQTVTDKIGGALATTPKGTKVDILVRTYPSYRRAKGAQKSYPVSAIAYVADVKADQAATPERVRAVS